MKLNHDYEIENLRSSIEKRLSQIEMDQHRIEGKVNKTLRDAKDERQGLY